MKRRMIGTIAVGAALALVLAPATASASAVQDVEVVQAEPKIAVFTGLAGQAYLGVSVDEVEDATAERLGMSDVHGVLIAEVVEDGPAAAAGLQVDDILTSWNGERLESLAQLQRHLRETPAGREVRLGLFRDGSEREVRVSLGERPSYQVFAAPDAYTRIEPRALAVPGPGNFRFAMAGGRGRLGVNVQSLGDQLADYFGVDGGVLVIAVSEDSPAERAGIMAGDVILGIAGNGVEDVGDLVSELAERDPGPVVVRVMRERSERTITVELEDRQSSHFLSCDDDDDAEACEAWRESWSGFAEAYSDDWQDWAERYAGQWEDWAHEYSGDWEVTAEGWREWAEQFSRDWKTEWNERGNLPHYHFQVSPSPKLDAISPRVIKFSPKAAVSTGAHAI